MAQYLTAAELDRLLGVFRRLLKADGTLIVGDIVPPKLAAPAAALALLRFAAANGFFFAAVLGLMRIFVSDYLRLKKPSGFRITTRRRCWQSSKRRAMRRHARHAISGTIRGG